MPIRDFLQDANGDLAVVNGDFARSGGDSVDANQAAVKQAIAIRVKFFLAEYFLDESIGVDWLGQILVKNPDQVVVVELIREAIMSTPDVVAVASVDLVDDGDRRWHVDYVVQTVYSTTTIDGSIASP